MTTRDWPQHRPMPRRRRQGVVQMSQPFCSVLACGRERLGWYITGSRDWDCFDFEDVFSPGRRRDEDKTATSIATPPSAKPARPSMRRSTLLRLQATSTRPLSLSCACVVTQYSLPQLCFSLLQPHRNLLRPLSPSYVYASMAETLEQGRSPLSATTLSRTYSPTSCT